MNSIYLLLSYYYLYFEYFSILSQFWGFNVNHLSVKNHKNNFHICIKLKFSQDVWDQFLVTYKKAQAEGLRNLLDIWESSFGGVKIPPIQSRVKRGTVLPFLPVG